MALLNTPEFLILDEPEINLHPGFQVEFAEILVLAARDLNITLYINTHSPFFAEAIEAYSRYYNLIDDTNFYLTEKVDGIDKYNYNLLDNDEIIEVYDNLGNPFDIIHKIKVQADLKDDLRD
jgi:ABC-type multidrug transport system ATPase subunit